MGEAPPARLSPKIEAAARFRAAALLLACLTCWLRELAWAALTK